MPISASAAQVAAALNSLPSIQAGVGAGAGTVSVTENALDTYTVLFSGSFTGAGQPWSQQNVTVNGLVGETFTLNFTGYTPTAPVTIGATPFLTQQALQTAVTALLTNPSSPGNLSGTATVVYNANTGTYDITFGGSLANVSVPTLVVTPATAQAITVPGTDTSGQTFTLNFPGYAQAATVMVGANPAATQGNIQTAVNTLLGFVGAGATGSPGGGTGTANVALVNGQDVVTFAGSLTGVDVPLLNEVNGTATASVSALDVASVAHVQWLTVSTSPQVITPTATTGTFALGFAGYGPTVSAPYSVTAAQLQTYLNTLLATSQQIAVGGANTQTFTLKFTGYTTTATVAIGATPILTAGNIAMALNTILLAPVGLPPTGSPGNGTGTATVSIDPVTGDFYVTFGGSLAGVAAPLLVAAPVTATSAVASYSAPGGGGGTATATSWWQQGITIVGTTGQTFTLNFNTYTPTVQVTVQATPQATAIALQGALNYLLSNPAGGSPGGGTGTATVVYNAAGLDYVVNFGGSLTNASVPLLVGTTITASATIASQSEPFEVIFGGDLSGMVVPPVNASAQQSLAVTDVLASGNQQFVLNFTGYTPTATFTAFATAAATENSIQTALASLLANVGAAPGGSPGAGTGTAAVSIDPTSGDYVVSFGGSLTGVAVPLLIASPVQQALAVSGSNGSFALNFTGFTPTTTANFVIPAVGTAVTFNVTSNAGMLASGVVYIADGTNAILATVTAAPAGQLTIKPTAIITGAAGNTMALGADLLDTIVPFNVTATGLLSAIQSNLLNTPLSPGGGGGTIAVTVDAVTGNFDITFAGSLANLAVPLLIGTAVTGNASAVNTSSTTNVAAVTTATDALTGNFSFVGEVLQGGTSNATPTSWFSSGPGPVANAAVNLEGTTSLANVAGPVTSIVTDPNDTQIIYIATANGGAWKTDNGGTTWTPLFDSLSTVQQFNITGIDPTTDAYSLIYTSPTTGMQSSTASIPYDASAAQIQAALDNVVGEGNSVSVDQNINANGQDEVEELTLNTTNTTWTSTTANPQHPTSFTLSYGAGRNNTTNQIQYTGVPTTDAGDIQTALNGLQTLTSIGASVSVSVVAGAFIPATQGVATDESFDITFGGSLADANAAKLIGFQIGGGFGGQFWQGPNPPSPFPTINLTTATHQGFGGGAINFDGGSLPIVIAGQGPTTTNTITFGGGALATENVAPLMFTSTGATTISLGLSAVTLTSGSGYTLPQAIIAGGTTAATSIVYGAVTAVKVGAGGNTGYQSTPAVVFTGGGGSGAAAVATVVGGKVTVITVTSAGSGYTSAPTVTLLGGNPTAAATATATLSITNVAVTTAGAGYNAATVNVVITDNGVAPVGGVMATAFATLNAAGGIGSVTVTSGSGYNADPAVTIAGTGANAAATTTIVGAVSGLAVTNGGIHYLSTPVVSIVNGGGTGATAAAIVNPNAGGTNQLGQVTQLILTSGYTGPATVTFTGGFGTAGGTTAVAKVTGAVTAINMTNLGLGYQTGVNQPTVGITDMGGTGAGATAFANVNAAGQIQDIVVTNGGANYTGPIRITISRTDCGPPVQPGHRHRHHEPDGRQLRGRRPHRGRGLHCPPHGHLQGRGGRRRHQRHRLRHRRRRPGHHGHHHHRVGLYHRPGSLDHPRRQQQ